MLSKIDNFNNFIFLFAVYNVLSSVLSSLCTERERLKVALEFDNSALSNVGLSSSSVGGLGALPGLRASLNQALQQNQDLRTRLARIHEAADLSDVSAVSNDMTQKRPFFFLFFLIFNIMMR